MPEVILERPTANIAVVTINRPEARNARARIVLSAARELERRGGRYAVVSLCIGVGHGIAVVIERV